MPIDVWRQTISSEAESIGGCLIAAGVFSILYGRLFVGRMLSEYGELEKQVSQILCFEVGIILTVAGILFMIRYYAT
jgi:hypothetical protein